ncbi:hypothetical protein EVAR_17130_1 [Eumeta japonica]|uniref:Uncharacterized protein n=1 Tax=Eumeta variegata TaxID=151549 RepID=A0A4C1ULW5_EUMVA|nr:hypothetical protein EVAR_17130_1 [Eumeta japonica]
MTDHLRGEDAAFGGLSRSVTIADRLCSCRPRGSDDLSAYRGRTWLPLELAFSTNVPDNYVPTCVLYQVTVAADHTVFNYNKLREGRRAPGRRRRASGCAADPLHPPDIQFKVTYQENVDFPIVGCGTPCGGIVWNCSLLRELIRSDVTEEVECKKGQAQFRCELMF